MTTIERLKEEQITKEINNYDLDRNYPIIERIEGIIISQHTEDVEEFKKKINDFKGIIKNCGNLKVIEYFDKIENEYKTFWVGDEPYINVILSLIEEDLLSFLEKDDDEVGEK